jgi:excisionase family DNA binding protein
MRRRARPPIELPVKPVGRHQHVRQTHPHQGPRDRRPRPPRVQRVATRSAKDAASTTYRPRQLRQRQPPEPASPPEKGAIGAQLKRTPARDPSRRWRARATPSGRSTGRSSPPYQAAALLKVKTSWIYEATRTGRLPSIRFGRHRFTQAMLEEGLSERSRGSEPGVLSVSLSRGFAVRLSGTPRLPCRRLGRPISLRTRGRLPARASVAPPIRTRSDRPQSFCSSCQRLRRRCQPFLPSMLRD